MRVNSDSARKNRYKYMLKDGGALGYLGATNLRNIDTITLGRAFEKTMENAFGGADNVSLLYKKEVTHRGKITDGDDVRYF